MASSCWSSWSATFHTAHPRYFLSVINSLLLASNIFLQLRCNIMQSKNRSWLTGILCHLCDWPLHMFDTLKHLGGLTLCTNYPLSVLFSPSGWPAIQIQGWFDVHRWHTTQFVTFSWRFALPLAKSFAHSVCMIFVYVLECTQDSFIQFIYPHIIPLQSYWFQCMVYTFQACWSINVLTQIFTC